MTNENIVGAFIGSLIEFESELEALLEQSRQHFYVNPDDIHYGHIEVLNDMAKKLNQISAMAKGLQY